MSEIAKSTFEKECEEVTDKYHDDICDIDAFMSNENFVCLGHDRWNLFPKVKNIEYMYLCEILDHIREAFKQSITSEGSKNG